MAAAPFATVTNESELTRDFTAIAWGTGSYTITLVSGFAFDRDPLAAINFSAGGSLATGGDATLNGADTQRGFIVYSGNATINNLTLDDMQEADGADGNAAFPGGGTAPSIGDQVSGLVANRGSDIFQSIWNDPSEAPHLHFSLLDKPDPLAGRSLPFVFASFTLDGWVDFAASKEDRLVIRPDAQKVRSAYPLYGSIQDYP